MPVRIPDVEPPSVADARDRAVPAGHGAGAVRDVRAGPQVREQPVERGVVDEEAEVAGPDLVAQAGGMADGADRGGGPALFRLVRFWSRRWARGVATDVGAGAGAAAELPQHVLVVDAVDALCRGGAEATIGALAARLGPDRSGASRMVTAATAAGHVDRRRSDADGRHAVLALTPAGRALLAASHRWQQATFAELTAAWAGPDRARFAAYLERLAREVGA